MSRQPDPWKSLRDEFRKLQDQIRRMQAASPFFGTGFHPNGDGGMDSDNFVAGTSGYSFKADGNAEFNDITLRGGIIGNDALTEPLRAVQVHDDAQGFSVPTGLPGALIMSVNVPVPAGYTRALLLNLTVGVSALNNTASTDFLYSMGKFSGSAQGWQIGSPDVNASTTGVAYDIRTMLVTGVSGSVTIEGYVSSAFAPWSANTNNVANLDAAILFLR